MAKSSTADEMGGKACAIQKVFYALNTAPASSSTADLVLFFNYALQPIFHVASVPKKKSIFSGNGKDLGSEVLRLPKAFQVRLGEEGDVKECKNTLQKIQSMAQKDGMCIVDYIKLLNGLLSAAQSAFFVAGNTAALQNIVALQREVVKCENDAKNIFLKSFMVPLFKAERQGKLVEEVTSYIGKFADQNEGVSSFKRQLDKAQGIYRLRRGRAELFKKVKDFNSYVKEIVDSLPNAPVVVKQKKSATQVAEPSVKTLGPKLDLKWTEQVTQQKLQLTWAGIKPPEIEDSEPATPLATTRLRGSSEEEPDFSMTSEGEGNACGRNLDLSIDTNSSGNSFSSIHSKKTPKASTRQKGK